jgi:hypothetical protein
MSGVTSRTGSVVGEGMRSRSLHLVVGVLVVVAALAPRAWASEPSAPVAPGHELDFWLGHWQVTAEGKLDGVDSVRASLGGFAVHEWWHGVQGDQGESIFWYAPSEKRWTQVWVTDRGPYKIKRSEPWPDGIRFSGEVFLPDGRSLKDRTTLTQNRDGTVRQVIERSRDGGATWITSYDAVYRRVNDH